MKILNFGHFSVLVLNATSGVEIQIYDEAVETYNFSYFRFLNAEAFFSVRTELHLA
jgi:hypothetical protein